MWLVWYFLLIFGLMLFVLFSALAMNLIDSKIRSGNYRAIVLKAVLITMAALTIWGCLLLQPFNLTNLEHHWWGYLAAPLVTVRTVGQWCKVVHYRRQKYIKPTPYNVKFK